jgi:hypothetical protein
MNGKTHKENVLKTGKPEELPDKFVLSRHEINIKERNKKVIVEDDICKISLSNNEYVLIDNFVWDIIKNYWISPGGKYPKIDVNKTYSLHRFIYYNIFNRVPRIGYQIDHKNRSKLDVTIKNLNEVLADTNNRNKEKVKNCTSKYSGVARKGKKWRCQIVFNKQTIAFLYDNELHAAYHYNLLIVEYGLDHCSPFNDVEKPEDFIIKTNRPKNRPIFQKNDKFYYKIGDDKNSILYDTYEETLEQRDLKLKEKKDKNKNDKFNEIDNLPILRNELNEPIIHLSTKNKSGQVKNVTIKIDAHRYHEVLKLGIGLRKNYVNVNKYNMVLSRYLINCTDKLKQVDHKDGDVYNYQMNNLRAVTILQNNQNKGAMPKSSSKFVGVYKSTNDKWRTKIGKKDYGMYATEYEAAMARDMKAYELNLLGNMYRINLPDELQINLFLKALKEENFQFNYLFY